MAGEDAAGVGGPAESLAGDGTALDAVGAEVWSEIQALFVDDPHDSVAHAADMVEEAVEAFMTTVRERQATLATWWQGQDADTERLRAAFQEYRAFWASMTEISQSA